MSVLPLERLLEYLGKEKARKGAPRRPGVFTTDWLLTDDRGGFSFDGHRLSSLYRNPSLATWWLIGRYFSAFSLPKYSTSTSAGVTAPGMVA